MKTIKTIFAILFLSTMFFACEGNNVDEELGIEVEEAIGEDDADEVVPG